MVYRCVLRIILVRRNLPMFSCGEILDHADARYMFQQDGVVLCDCSSEHYSRYHACHIAFVHPPEALDAKAREGRSHRRTRHGRNVRLHPQPPIHAALYLTLRQPVLRSLRYAAYTLSTLYPSQQISHGTAQHPPTGRRSSSTSAFSAPRSPRYVPYLLESGHPLSQAPWALEMLVRVRGIGAEASISTWKARSWSGRRWRCRAQGIWAMSIQSCLIRWTRRSGLESLGMSVLFQRHNGYLGGKHAYT